MSFSDDLRRFAEKTNRDVNQVIRGTAIRLFSAIIEDTPVDLGRLRANWMTSVGNPNYSISDNTDKDGSLTVSKMMGIVNGAQPGSDFHMTNSLPYAYRIEFEGWSHEKAPQGMVRKNVIRFQELVREELAAL